MRRLQPLRTAPSPTLEVSDEVTVNAASLLLISGVACQLVNIDLALSLAHHALVSWPDDSETQPFLASQASEADAGVAQQDIRGGPVLATDISVRERPAVARKEQPVVSQLVISNLSGPSITACAS